MRSFYTLYDKKLEQHNFPFPSEDDKRAIATVARAIESGQDGIISKAPQDFVLYRCFDFDENTGAITPNLVKLQDFAEIYPDGVHR